METKPRHNQYILAAAGDHEVLSQAIDNFRKLFSGKEMNSTSPEVAKLMWLLGTKLPHHFSYEEEQVFPSLVVEQPQTKPSIDVLCREHAVMLKEAKRLHKLLSSPDLAKHEAEIWSAMLDLFAELQKHTGQEDKLFKPYIVQQK
jgi:iron-sulfur cluster repair protein YtfE (RIC family)